MSTFTHACYFISENSISIGTEPSEASTDPQATNPPPQAGNEEWTKEESRLCQSTIVHQKGRPVVFICFCSPALSYRYLVESFIFIQKDSDPHLPSPYVKPFD
ncbi:hypothetical protein TNCV_1342721 [Trichonephila clavipes]|nr:hypothetical protein TNCV_1342721 [Trichonephila clavipes]